MLRLLFFCLFLFICCPPAGATGAVVRKISISGPITPVVAGYLQRNLQEAEAGRENLVLITMDTPGGLDSAMRDSVKLIMSSTIPVVVYVAPSGARAASAGAVIALAADICAMAPGTNIGAAHPVTMGEKPDKVMMDKVVNDAEAYLEGIAAKRGKNVKLAGQMVRESLSLSADKALDGKIIDMISADQAQLLAELHGLSLIRDGKKLVIETAGAEVRGHEMVAKERILNVISNPNVAYVLMMLGFLGIFFELSNPGVMLPGIVGGISLILAFFALQALPVNYAGVLLLLLALVLFIAEIKIISHGMLTVGGVICLVLGSLFLFESSEPYLRVSWSVITVTVLATTVFFVSAVALSIKAHRKKPLTGIAGLIGERGTAETDLNHEGKVFVHGEYWQASSDSPVRKGEEVAVVAVEGMRLKVKKA
ncbi:NfeD family protein [Geotalea toluenoxydans]|uniref:NfeD family protein n=1 Tax=Geotalea toluenoxydans TaxID=421624 RepID=UPI000B0146D9|nr:nodulation protein NfeD [Geotalea toluenoxydans]